MIHPPFLLLLLLQQVLRARAAVGRQEGPSSKAISPEASPHQSLNVSVKVTSSQSLLPLEGDHPSLARRSVEDEGTRGRMVRKPANAVSVSPQGDNRRASPEVRAIASAGTADADEQEVPEWVQPILQSEEPDLRAETVGKLVVTPPATMRMQSLHHIPEETAAAAAAAAEADAHTSFLGSSGGTLLADVPLEVPSRVEVVVQVEALELPVVYAFRWGKPASWADHDYMLEVTEAGVYSLDLLEPLMLPLPSKKRLLQPLGDSVEIHQAAFAVYPRRAPGFGEGRLTPRIKGEFQRLASSAGCKLSTRSGDSLQGGKTGEIFSHVLVKASGKELNANLRKSSVPLFYSVQLAPRRGRQGTAITPVRLLRHSLCLVYSGPPMRQLVPLDEVGSQTTESLLTATDEAMLTTLLAKAFFENPTVTLARKLKTLLTQEAAKDVKAKTLETMQEAPEGRGVHTASRNPEETPSSPVQRPSQRRRPKCIFVSQLPDLEGIVPSLNPKSTSSSGGASRGDGMRQRLGARTGLTLSQKASGGEDDIDSHRLDAANAAYCEAPYSDYVFLTQPLRLNSQRQFNAEAAAETCRRAWSSRPCSSEDSAEASRLAAVSSSQGNGQKGSSCHRNVTAGQALYGKQLREAPSATFVWSQVISLYPAGDPAFLPMHTPLALWSLMERGQCPCALLSFRGWESSRAQPRHDLPFPAHAGLNEENAVFLNSCALFAAAVQEGLITEEILMQPGVKSWPVPQQLLPAGISKAAGSVVYHVGLLVPMLDESVSNSEVDHDAQQQQQHKQVHTEQQDELNLNFKQSLVSNGKLWLLQQALEVREPQYGEWRLRLRRNEKAHMTPLMETSAADNNSAADALTLFVVRRSCESVLEAASKSSPLRLPAPSHRHAALPLGKVAPSDESERPTFQHSAAVAESGEVAVTGAPWGGLAAAEAQGEQPSKLGASSRSVAGVSKLHNSETRDVNKTNRIRGGSSGRLGGQQLDVAREDCTWCSSAFAGFFNPSSLRPYVMQLALKVGVPARPSDVLLPTSSQALRLSELPQEQTHIDAASSEAAATSLATGAPAFASFWRPVGPPAFSYLTLSPATASGGRHLSVFVDFFPFAAARRRRCSPLLLTQTSKSTKGPLQGPGQLYFYSLQLQISRDAVPLQRRNQEGFAVELMSGDWQAAAAAAGKGAGPRSLKSISSSGSSAHTAAIQLPVFCEDLAPFEKDGFTTKEVASLGSSSWTLTEEMLPAAWDWQPTTYVLQWQLLEAATREEQQELEGRLKQTPLHKADSDTQLSDADVYIHLVASTNVSKFCSQPCPVMSSCTATESIDGFTVFGCRCAFGYTGATCEYESASVWLRLLAQGTLIFSNLALLPTVFLCVRLAIRHLRCIGASRSCPVCVPKQQGHLQQKSGIREVWSRQSCFLLHSVRAIAYFNAFLWSFLYHACLDASALLPLEAPKLQSADYLFAHFALFVTALALADVGSNAVELLALAATLAYLGFAWLPHTMEQSHASLFIIACFSLPLISLGLKASTRWGRSQPAKNPKRFKSLETQWGEWRPEDVKWLDGTTSPSKTETNASEPREALHARHQELQLLLKQRMEEARETVCLAAVGQAIARLEAAHKCRVALCCSSSPSLSLWHCLKAKLASACKRRSPHVGVDEKVMEPTSSASAHVLKHLQAAAIFGPSKEPLTFMTCAGIALTEVAPRVELLALGLMLAACGLGCWGVTETSDYYWLLHSLWHVFIQTASCLILLSKLHHPILSELSCFESLPQSAAALPRFLAGSTRALPSRSLSEALASIDRQAHVSSNARAAQGRLAPGFLRALHESRHPCFISHPHDVDAASEGCLHPEPQRHSHHFTWSDSTSSMFHGNHSHSDIQQLLASLVWLLMHQYPTHQKLHAHRLASEVEEEQQQSCAPSPTNGEEGLLRLGAAASMSPLPSPCYPSSTSSNTSPAESACAAGQLAVEGRDCLWCIVRETLDDVSLTKVHEQRMHWACKLQFVPILRCFPLPRWLYQPLEDFIEWRQQWRRWTNQQSDGNSIYYCS
ncbi:hypothetical protein Esti_003065 [Eimeria stiedai]